MGGNINVLIWGSFTRLSAVLSGTVTNPSADMISNVWRFGRDTKHLTNEEAVDTFHCSCTVINLRGTTYQPLTQGQKVQRSYFTLAAKNMFACEAFPIALSLPANTSPEFQLRRGVTSRRSHTQGSNRIRIVRHVTLNGRRNFTRC